MTEREQFLAEIEKKLYNYKAMLKRAEPNSENFYCCRARVAAYEELLIAIKDIAKNEPIKRFKIGDTIRYKCGDNEFVRTITDVEKSDNHGVIYKFADGYIETYDGAGIELATELILANSEKSSEDLEQAATNYKMRTPFQYPNELQPAYEGFKAGAKWDREQMMKDAVEGYIEGDQRNQEDEPYDVYAVSDSLDTKKFKIGDKVKVIIVKDND